MFLICWVGHLWSHKWTLMENLIFWGSVLKPIQLTRIRWTPQLSWARTTILSQCSTKLWWQDLPAMTKSLNNSNNSNLNSNNQTSSRQTSSSLWVSNSAHTNNSNNRNSNSSHNLGGFKRINSSRCLLSIKIQWWGECLSKINSKPIPNLGSVRLTFLGSLAALP